MIINSAIMYTIRYLRQHDALSIDQKDADILLAESLKKNTAFVAAHPEYHLTPSEYFRFRWFIFHRKRGYSVAAIVGHKEFCGLDFIVNRHTLIPRPDTEVLVESALAKITADSVLVDVGTGSGCIPISILKKTAVRPAWTYAIDISVAALRIAKKNALHHGVAIQFLRGNLLQPVLKIFNFQFSIFKSLIITANLPYLTLEQAQSEPSLRREPMTALVAKEGGVALYRELFTQIQRLPCQRPITILCEIDPRQNESMMVLIKNFFPNASLEIKKDLAGLDRLIIITLS